LSATPKGVAESFHEGNSLYQAGEYAGAASAYERALSQGFEAPALFYNLGNAELKSGRIGRAIWAYRRSLRLDPRGEDVRANLEYARSLTADVPPPAQEPGLIRLFATLENALPPTVSLRLAAFGYWILCAMVAASWLLPRRGRWARHGALGGAVLLALGLLLAGMGSLRYGAGREGVVLDRELAVRTGPDANSTVVFTLHEGAEVEVGRRAEKWMEIRVSDELKGWAEAAAVGIL
jgi:tetratricopeptide (TPR) repeat protein